MSIFRRKKFTVSERDPSYKVRYLGNVQTTLMKGDGCVDKPTAVLWNNYLKTSNPGIEMKLNITASGLKATTKEQGLTEYRAHRISYCIAHPKYPKLFVWVYRHEGKRMKVELRCHAVLCKNEEKAMCMALQLHEKLTVALTEFRREKTRQQKSRLLLQKTTSNGGNQGTPLRKQMLSTGKNYKPPVERSASAPKLALISEDQEEAAEEESCRVIMEENEEEDVVEEDVVYMDLKLEGDDEASLGDNSLGDGEDLGSAPDSPSDTELITNGVFELEVGNDIEALKNDEKIKNAMAREDSDADSSESGFSEQDSKESTSTNHSAPSSSQNGTIKSKSNGTPNAKISSLDQTDSNDNVKGHITPATQT